MKLTIIDQLLRMIMRKVISHALCLFLLVYIAGCDDDVSYQSTDPIDFDHVGWTCDTLAFSTTLQTLLTELWGVDTAYIVAAGFCSESGGSLWEYQDDAWQPVNVKIRYQSASHLIPMAVFGNSESDYYVAGKYLSVNTKGFIGRNEGRYYLIDKPNLKTIVSGSIDKRGKFALGSDKGTVYVVSDSGWVETALQMSEDSSQQISRRVVDILMASSGAVYASLATYSSLTGEVYWSVFRIYNNNVIQLNSTEYGGRYPDKMVIYETSNGSIYIAGGQKIYKVVGSELTRMCEIVTKNYVVDLDEDQHGYVYAITSRGDIFNVTDGNTIFVGKMPNHLADYQKILLLNGHVYVLSNITLADGRLASLVCHGTSN